MVEQMREWNKVQNVNERGDKQGTWKDELRKMERKHFR